MAFVAHRTQCSGIGDIYHKWGEGRKEWLEMDPQPDGQILFLLLSDWLRPSPKTQGNHLESLHLHGRQWIGRMTQGIGEKASYWK